jgi:hypothetical protein
VELATSISQLGQSAGQARKSGTWYKRLREEQGVVLRKASESIIVCLQKKINKHNGKSLQRLFFDGKCEYIIPKRVICLCVIKTNGS